MKKEQNITVSIRLKPSLVKVLKKKAHSVGAKFSGFCAKILDDSIK